MMTRMTIERLCTASAALASHSQRREHDCRSTTGSPFN